ncbi:hypothetical protein [Halomonas sp. WWR20]
MLSRKQRNITLMSAWLLALAAAPYATILVVTFNHEHPGEVFSGLGFLAYGIVLFTSAFFMLTLLACKLSNDLDETVECLNSEREKLAEMKKHYSEDLTPESQEHGLKILRMSEDSPIRGKVTEKAVIHTINGQHPTSAAEANSALVLGTNQIEWADTRGKVHHSNFLCRKADLKAQFEQTTAIRLQDIA